MLPVNFDNVRNILCLGAHSDDLEIGCGGALLKLLAERPGLNVHWVVFSGIEVRAAEAIASAKALLTPAAHNTINVHRFRDTFFPYVGSEIKEIFAKLQHEAKPDLIFTHRLEDRHQDHRLISELTWNAFRDHAILEYEIPKYEGDLASPNFFVPLSDALAKQKISHLLDYFPSQAERTWFSASNFAALMRLRAIECNAKSGFAEAFYCRKLVLQ